MPESDHESLSSPSSEVASEATIDALLGEVNVKVGGLVPAPNQMRYDEFLGTFEDQPVMFAVSQMPIEHGSDGVVANISLFSNNRQQAARARLADYKFILGSDGVEIEKILPVNQEDVFAEWLKLARQSGDSIYFDDPLLIKMLKENRERVAQQDSAFAPGDLEEREARDLLKALTESVENPDRNGDLRRKVLPEQTPRSRTKLSRWLIRRLSN